LIASAVWAALVTAVPSRVYAQVDAQALRDARAVAAQRPDLTVMLVSGQSMLPYFEGGTVIVTQTIDARRLRVGMIAVYAERFGRTVVHRVEARVDGGWRVKGYHNNRADSTLVNGGNLLGIVYATFQPAAPPSAQTVDSSSAIVGTAYAAPAK
jgi:signal peptidase I